MSHDNSDYTKPKTDLFKLLPTVHRSDVNKSVVSNVFNRFLTKPELEYVSGYVGQAGNEILYRSPIQEPTVGRQAFQLQPMLYTKIGTVEHMATYEDILNELIRLGVDTDRLPVWGNALQFNWVPPVDIDKLLHYQDYYWYDPENPASRPQYFTIRNQCNVAEARVYLYEQTLVEYGNEVTITGLNSAEQTFTLAGDVTELFVPGLTFYTTNSTNSELNDRWWVAESATYIPSTNETVVGVNQPFVNDSVIDGVVSLESFLSVLQGEISCSCYGSPGWGSTQWDDNWDSTTHLAGTVWNEALLLDITYPTESEWLLAHTPVPVMFDLWFDTTEDKLKQWNGVVWVTVQQGFSYIVAETTGGNYWGASDSCTPTQRPNQWIAQNKWRHRTTIPNFSIAKQAKLPILEYSSTVEMNEWVKVSHQWKYRSNPLLPFSETDSQPHLIELVGGGLTVASSNTSDNTIVLSSDYLDQTETFIPGFVFEVINGGLLDGTYTVDYSFLKQNIITGQYETVIATTETIPTNTTYANVAPVSTSLGNSWEGYHNHWVYVGVSDTVPQGNRTLNPLAAIADSVPPQTEKPLIYGSSSYLHRITKYAQEFTLTVTGMSTVYLGHAIANVDTGLNFFDISGNHQDVFVVGSTFTVYNSTGNDSSYVVSNSTYNIADGYTRIFVTTSVSDATADGMIYSTGPFQVYGFTRSGLNNTRVYIDGVRQYGNYTEISDSGGFLIGVTFDQQIGLDAVVTVCLGPDTLQDGGLHNVDVRMDESDLWSSTVPVNLLRNIKIEQVKTQLNQYPLFNMYNVDGSDAFKVSPIFTFRESSSCPLNLYVSKRIVQDNKEFDFEQHLIDEDNGPMYTYRDLSLQHNDYWYNPETETVKEWSGSTWDTKVFSDGYYADTIVSELQPTSPWNDINEMVWAIPSKNLVMIGIEETIVSVNHSNDIIRVAGIQVSTFPVGRKFVVGGTEQVFTVDSVSYDAMSDLTEITTSEHISTIAAGNIIQWVSVSADVSVTDTTIRTIWKKGTNNEEYVPSFVNADRQDVSGSVQNDWDIPNQLKDSSVGSWEIPNQLYYNASHENRKVLKLTELTEHFNTIINAQPPLPGFLGGARQTFHVMPEVNYGVGGTIKEFNDGFDTLLSSTFINNVTPVSLIGFAHDQYESSLATLKEYFRRGAIGYLTNVTPTNIVSLSENISSDVIEQYELNDALSLTYGDSSTFDPSTGKGVRNWIITLPFMGLAEKRKPVHLFDATLGVNQVIHHDGHISDVVIRPAVQEFIIQNVISTNDTRMGRELGMQSSSSAPSTVSSFKTAYGVTQLYSGVYWYRVVGSSRTLYRLNIAQASSLEPTAALPDGALWYDTGNDILKVLNSSTWSVVIDPVTSLPVLNGDISLAWKEINLENILADIFVEVENRLYDAAPSGVAQAFDFEELQQAEPLLYNNYLEESFGDYTHSQNILTPYSSLSTYDILDAFTWNYSYSIPTLLPGSATPLDLNGGTWQDLYTKAYGTPYPHLEPWKLQGYLDKPEWWDVEYADDTGTRRWKYVHPTTTGMWENIRVGLVPAGEVLPNGEVSTGMSGQIGVPTYNYFSVNIGDIEVNDVPVDGLFPPYTVIVSSSIRSIFGNLTEVSNQSFDYVFGDAGQEEWKWRVASQYMYDQLNIAFRMQPARFMNSTFGNEIVLVAGLQVDRNTRRVPTHTSAIFHGDVVDGNVYVAKGMNQWYVNYNRFGGFDLSSSDFRMMWSSWTTPLSYQFSSFVDTSSLFITNKDIDVTTQDFAVSTKRSLGIQDQWADALTVTVLYSPPSRMMYDTEAEWRFDLSTTSPIGRRTPFYGVRNYKFTVDPVTNYGVMYRYNVIAVDIATSTFVVSGNQTEVFVANSTFTISSSSFNDNVYVVVSSVYDSVTKGTTITVENTIASNVADGVIVADYRTIPWVTGDTVQVSTTQILPSPLVKDTTYYVIKRAANKFELAETYEEALGGISIVVENDGRGEFFVGQVKNTFSTSTTSGWKHFELDKSYINSFVPPTEFQGIQNLVNIIDGYIEYIQDSGFIFGFENYEQDPITGNAVTWQNEISQFIDWAYLTRKYKHAVYDSYGATVDSSLNQFTFNETVPTWNTGTKVTISTTAGSLPSPLLGYASYYIIRDDNDYTKFSLALTSLASSLGQPIDLLDIGSGEVIIQEFVSWDTLPSMELNAFRNNLWFNHPQGIISNIINGPYLDIRTEQTIYDQYGRLLGSDKVTILREDQQSHIFVKENVVNDVEDPKGDPRKNLHIGGIHLFLDGFEHVIMFNNYAADGSLVYDPFLGINTPRFNMEFDRQIEFNLRPNVGGYYLKDNKLIRNIEASILDLQNAYDTFRTSESTLMTQYSRELLGYDGASTYLDALDVNTKSQFLFWKGMIQSKGSINSVKAFVNSRKFVDAKIDEFWAYKISEFGSVHEKTYPQLKLTSRDSLVSELKFEFTSITGSVDSGFEKITTETQDRWFEYPTQISTLEQLDPMYFDAEVTSANVITSAYDLNGGPGGYYYTTDVPCDKVVITWVNGLNTETLDEGVDFVKLNSNVIWFPTNDPVVDFSGPTIYTLNPAKSKLNPAKIIDVKSGSVITDVAMWDPARGHHYHNAIHLVDLQRDEDPAYYTNAKDLSVVSGSAWNKQEEGMTWLDTSVVSYVPYYDETIFTTTNERIRNWGALSDWASVNIFQWTKSDVPPEEWDALAIKQEGDKTIPESDRKSGYVRKVLMKNLGAGLWAPEVDQYYETYGVYANDTAFIPIFFPTLYGTVDIFVNGKYLVTTDITTRPTFNDGDHIHMIKRAHVPSSVELDNGDYVYDYPHTKVTTIDSDGVSEITTYYFWVGGKKVRPSDKMMSLFEAEQQLTSIPIPYLMVQKFIEENSAQPNRYVQSIIRGLAGVVGADDRYTLRFTRDFTLRADLEDGVSPLDLKDTHTEWELIREKQPYYIPRALWNNVTEAMIGFALTSATSYDVSNRVPTLARVLYDSTNGTDTQYGLRTGQTLVDSDMAIATVLADLENPENSFYPIDINIFFQNYSFEGATDSERRDNIVLAMDAIYNTFSYEHVNRIFFSVLMDAFSKKAKYPDIFKTSMVSLHGIKLLETTGT